MNNEKLKWIQSLYRAGEIINDINNRTDGVKITFVTSFGFIVGQLKEFTEYKLDSLEQFEENLREKIKLDGKFEIDTMTLANAIYKLSKDEQGSENKEILHLSNAIIYCYHDNYIDVLPIPIEQISLFLDNIIAVIPGEITIKIKS